MTDEHWMTRHRVHLPGPLTGALPRVVDHGPGCTDPATCPVIAALTAWLSTPGAVVQVQGDYFTEDGLSFERCAWQPGRTRW